MISTPTRKQLKVFGYGLAGILAFFSGKLWYDGGWHWLHGILLSLATVLIIVTAVAHQRLHVVYTRWMKVAEVIGQAVSYLTLTVLYYLVFTPVGIFLRLVRRDLLDRKWDAQAKTYWISRAEKPFIKENYHRPF
jgi:hypothetical protein